VLSERFRCAVENAGYPSIFPITKHKQDCLLI